MFNLQVTSTTMELLPLVCLCLLTRSGTTFAEEGSKVIRVEEDSDVTLPCSLSSKENISKMVFDWRKDGQKDVFLYDEGKHYNNGREGQDEQFKGRVSHFPDKLKHGDASIKINNTRVADSGDYTCEFPHLQPRQIFHIRLVVVGPKVIRVNQGSDVTLPCSLSSMGNIEFKLFDWKKDGQKDVFLYDAGLHYNNGRAGQDEQFKGRVSHFPDKLKLGDASIKINNTKLTDSGDYTCAFPRLQPSQIFHIRLVVGRILKDRSGENIPGSKVINVEEGSDVTLPCSLSSMEDIEYNFFIWRKDGQKEVFMYEGGFYYNNGREGQDEQFKGRVSHFPDELKLGNTSIIIRNTKLNDSGNYICAFPLLQPRQIFHIQLVVGPKVIRVEEDSDVTLPCSLSTKEDIELKLFEWTKDGQKVFLYDEGDHYNNGRDGQDEQFKGRVSHFPDKLKHGEASIIIRNTSVTDSGDYTCAFPRLQPRQIFHIWLVVGDLKDRSGENIPGAVPKPYVSILYETKDGTLLCEVQEASPKPKVEWQDSAGNILPAEEPQVSERGGRYDIILKTTVTKTDLYRCVATQEDINHQIYTETYMYIPGSSTGLVVAVSAVAAVLCTLLVVGGGVLYFLYKKGYFRLNIKKGSPQEPSVPLNRGSQTSRPQPSE
ncbi:CD276 antigen-like isoform X2 [Siniperca chuatsi]|uniref:CD276 antigen-like isoform X2 n=1 Tax=Siniperca chuatsi TaxID=119488 RepID=UPI001CE160A9|nr:CD276 antigen-like isoform X2 [Siniperca chuatsi]